MWKNRGDIMGDKNRKAMKKAWLVHVSMPTRIYRDAINDIVFADRKEEAKTILKHEYQLCSGMTEQMFDECAADVTLLLSDLNRSESMLVSPTDPLWYSLMVLAKDMVNPMERFRNGLIVQPQLFNQWQRREFIDR